ncbi:MFS transporter [Streptomyces sp. NPDC051322]|uniref:MFS transporter n=1 Tax=Streptomyces sp. NPDC051322 TaxID=3154645 RepID=UPI00344D9613
MNKSTGLYSRLGVMMVLEFLVFGSWFPTIGLVLSNHGLSSLIGLVFVFSSVAAVISPMFVGALADRFFQAQKVFGVLHLAGAAVLLCLPSAVKSGNDTLFLVLLFVFTIFFQPTQAMPNNIAFVHLKDRHDVFPYIRALGTGSWIVAGLIVGQTGLSASSVIFYLAAGWALLLGVYSFTLPATPPQQRNVRFRPGDVIGSGAFTLFRQRRFVVLMACMLLISVPISIYNAYGSTYLAAAGIKNVASVMSLGQACELVFILLLPLLLRTIGYRGVLAVGLICWVARCGLFMYMDGGHRWLAYVVVGMHGACNDFFMITACMYVDRMVAPALKAQAQALLFFLSIGVGQGLGALVAGFIYNGAIGNHPTTELGYWNALWGIATAVSLLTFVVFAVLFRERRADGPTPPVEPGTPEAAGPDASEAVEAQAAVPVGSAAAVLPEPAEPSTPVAARDFLPET